MKKIILFMTLAFGFEACLFGAEKEDFILHYPGKEAVVNYEKYGIFHNIGTKDYYYEITDKNGLSRAIGEGIHPNTHSILKDIQYKRFLNDGKLKGSRWDFVGGDNIEDFQANFYKWATAAEAPGVKLFYTAAALEEAGHIQHALKAYYAIVVHYPHTASWNAEQTFSWHIGPVAIDAIKYICRKNPELEIMLVDASIEIDDKGDNDRQNDIIIVNPGRFVKYTKEDRKKEKVDVSKLKIVKTIGKGKVKLLKFSNGHWQLKVNNKPYIIKGNAYGSTTVGTTPVEGTLEDWMLMDRNKNGKMDGPFDAWVDKDQNNKQDADEPVVGDFQLMKEMGCNAIRVYHHASNRELLRKLHKDYGIMVLMGDFLGMYATGSGADYDEGTDYSNPKHRENMVKSVKKMVMENKDEPYLLMWVLGNENNYSVACNVSKNPEVYYKFANQVAKIIHEMDPNHPVAINNGDLGYLEIFAEHCKDVDVFSCNSYRGYRGFTSVWEKVKNTCDKPVFIGEYGCPAYSIKGLEFGEEKQAEYHRGCWEDIMDNTAGNKTGNALGGVIFEWIDEWWKCGVDVPSTDGKAFSPGYHDTAELGSGPFPDGWGYSEWFGIVGQGDGKNSPYLRHLRKAYYLYKDIWNKEK
ncbi:MAG: hypothetical protein JW983_07000 [Elusimicrobia bacterium]|nr:hypothetical protein [Elusimicrobiota bacterium]